MKTRLFLQFIFLFLSLSLQSQDVVLTDYQLAPLQLNPALSGSGKGVRFGSFLQVLPGQVLGAQDGFTFGGSVDTPIKLSKTLTIGLGYQYMQDIVGEVKYGTKNHLLSAALIKSFSKNDIEHRISIGLEGGLNNRSLDGGNLKWPSQIGPNGYNPSLPSGETALDYSILYADMNLGMHYQLKKTTGSQLDGGIAIHHINTPNISFLGKSSPLNSRVSLYLKPKFMLTEMVGLTSTVYYTKQGVHDVITSSIGLELDIKKTKQSIGFNVGYQANKIPFVSLFSSYKNLKLGASAGFGDNFSMRKSEGFVTYTFPTKEKS